MNEKLFEIASKITRPISVASIVVIALYLIYRAILSLNVFHTLSESNSFILLDSIVNRIFILAVIALVLGTISFLYVQLAKNKLDFSQTFSITGNVYFDNELPAENATVFVEGVDRRKLTDSNGWFQIEVPKSKTWTIKAHYDDKVTSKVVKLKDVHNPVSVIFPKASPRT